LTYIISPHLHKPHNLSYGVLAPKTDRMFMVK